MHIHIHISRARILALSSAQFRVDLSSPQISAILVGRFTVDNYSLRKSPQNFHMLTHLSYTQAHAHTRR